MASLPGCPRRLGAAPGVGGLASTRVSRGFRLLPAKARSYLAITSILCASRSLSGEGTRALPCVLCQRRVLQAVGASCKRPGMQLSREISMLFSVPALPWVPSGHGISSGQVTAPPRAPLPSPVRVPLYAARDADTSQGESAMPGWGLGTCITPGFAAPAFAGHVPPVLWVQLQAAVTHGSHTPELPSAMTDGAGRDPPRLLFQ